MSRTTDLALRYDRGQEQRGFPIRRHEASIGVIGSTELERECLAFRLAAAGFAVTSAPSVAALHDYAACERVDLMLLYTSRPEQEIQGQLGTALSLYGRVPVAIMAADAQLRLVAMAVERGARGYITTSMPARLVIAAIRLVLVGGVYLPANRLLAATVVEPAPEALTWQGKFTKRQSAVMEAIRRGKPNKIIAHELNMCESTVKIHIRNMMRKLQARNRTELAFKANALIGPAADS